MNRNATLQGVQILPEEGEIPLTSLSRSIITTVKWLNHGLLFTPAGRTEGLKSLLFLVSNSEIPDFHDEITLSLRLGMNKASEQDEALFILFERAIINLNQQKKAAKADSIKKVEAEKLLHEENTRLTLLAIAKEEEVQQKEIDLARKALELAEWEKRLKKIAKRLKSK